MAKIIWNLHWHPKPSKAELKSWEKECFVCARKFSMKYMATLRLFEKCETCHSAWGDVANPLCRYCFSKISTHAPDSLLPLVLGWVDTLPFPDAHRLLLIERVKKFAPKLALWEVPKEDPWVAFEK